MKIKVLKNLKVEGRNIIAGKVFDDKEEKIPEAILTEAKEFAHRGTVEVVDEKKAPARRAPAAPKSLSNKPVATTVPNPKAKPRTAPKGKPRPKTVD